MCGLNRDTEMAFATLKGIYIMKIATNPEMLMVFLSFQLNIICLIKMYGVFINTIDTKLQQLPGTQFRLTTVFF